MTALRREAAPAQAQARLSSKGTVLNRAAHLPVNGIGDHNWFQPSTSSTVIPSRFIMSSWPRQVTVQDAWRATRLDPRAGDLPTEENSEAHVKSKP